MQQTISLCVDVRMSGSSGIGRFIRQLVPLLNQPPFRLVLLVDRLGYEWCQTMEQILFSAPIYSLREQLLFPIKIPRCDLFWSPHYNVPLFPIRAKKRIVTIHDPCHLVFRSFYPWFKRFCAWVLMKRAYLRSDVVATVSYFSKGELARFLGAREKVAVISPGIYQNNLKNRFLTASAFPRSHSRLASGQWSFVPNVKCVEHSCKNPDSPGCFGIHHNALKGSSNPEAIRLKYGLPQKFLLFVSNLLPHKNVPRLIEAFLKASVPERSLILVGKGKESDWERIAVSARLHGCIRWLGVVPDDELSLLYEMAEWFVFPSLYEGFGFPPLEAMAHGCPTLVSNAGSLPEVCGSATIYFDPLDVDALAQTIQKVCAEPTARASLVERGREQVSQFSWANTAESYRKLFEEELQKK